MAKYNEKIEAIALRKKGESIKKIAKKLKVSVSSVSMWTRDVRLTKYQLETLKAHARDPRYGKRLDYINKVKSQTDKKTKRLLNEGIEAIGNLSKRELFLIGSALYWGEGFKKDSQVGFANSDPTMISLFLKWLKVCFGYKNDDLIFRITLNNSHKGRIKEVTKYWSEITNAPYESFRKPFFQSFVWKKVYKNPNEYYGVLRVRVCKSRDFLRKILGFIEGLRLQSEMR